MLSFRTVGKPVPPTRTSPTTIITLLSVTVALLGIAALWRGLHGRRVGNHPFCRRCGFDLFNRAPDSSACPECGAALTPADRAIVIGTRQRRRGLIVAGLLLALLGLGGVGVVAWSTWQHFDWQQRKPIAWLLHDARNGADVPTQTAAVQELARR